MNTTAKRPTENLAIGNAMRVKPPRLSLGQLLVDRVLAGTAGLGER